MPHEGGTSAQQLPPAGPSGASPASRAGPEVDTLQTLGQGQVRKGLRLPSGERGRHRGQWLGGRAQRGAAAPSPSSRARPCPPGSGSLLPDSPFQSPEPRAVNRSRPHTLVSCSRRNSETTETKENLVLLTSSRYGSSHENPGVSSTRLCFLKLFSPFRVYLRISQSSTKQKNKPTQPAIQSLHLL